MAAQNEPSTSIVHSLFFVSPISPYSHSARAARRIVLLTAAAPAGKNADRPHSARAALRGALVRRLEATDHEAVQEPHALAGRVRSRVVCARRPPAPSFVYAPSGESLELTTLADGLSRPIIRSPLDPTCYTLERIVELHRRMGKSTRYCRICINAAINLAALAPLVQPLHTVHFFP